MEEMPNGYIIESEGKACYIAGDTALTYEMKLIPDTIGQLDSAILIGDNFTMGQKVLLLRQNMCKQLRFWVINLRYISTN